MAAQRLISKWSNKMPFTWQLNGNNDIQIENGRFLTVAGADEVKQRILVALQHFYQEYFLDVPDGVPWYEVILGSKNKKVVELVLRKKILEVPGVVGIISFQKIFNNITRHMDISAIVEVLGLDDDVVQVPLGLLATEPVSATSELLFAWENWNFAGA
jgi:hypothetical protein